MIRALLSPLAGVAWRDLLADLAQLAGVVVIIASIAMLAVGFAPDLPAQQ